MKLTVNEVIGINNGLGKIQVQGAKFNYCLIKNLDKIGKEIELFNKAVEQLKTEEVVRVLTKFHQKEELSKDEADIFMGFEKEVSGLLQEVVDIPFRNIRVDDIPDELKTSEMALVIKYFVVEE